MLAQIHKFERVELIKPLLLIRVAATIASCAHDDPPLITDPTATHETSLPWNEQQKWESQGPAAQGLNTQGRR